MNVLDAVGAGVTRDTTVVCHVAQLCAEHRAGQARVGTERDRDSESELRVKRERDTTDTERERASECMRERKRDDQESDET